MKNKKIPNIYHPSKILKEEFLIPAKLTARQLASNLNISEREIKAVLAEKKDLDKDMATRLALYFNTAPTFWINLQSNYNEQLVEKTLYKSLKKQVHPLVHSL